jgi:phage terminase small subunit
MARKLTEKQKQFVEEYLIDLNATQAAIRAGYSAKTANEKGSQLLTNERIQEAVSVAMAERSKRTGVNQDRVVLELAKIAFLNIGNLINLEDGSVLPTASEDDLACIESIRYKRSDSDSGSSVEREVKIGSKLKALELLGKHLGMWNDKLDVNIAQPIVITGADDLED